MMKKRTIAGLAAGGLAVARFGLGRTLLFVVVAAVAGFFLLTGGLMSAFGGDDGPLAPKANLCPTIAKKAEKIGAGTVSISDQAEGEAGDTYVDSGWGSGDVPDFVAASPAFTCADGGFDEATTRAVVYRSETLPLERIRDQVHGAITSKGLDVDESSGRGAYRWSGSEFGATAFTVRDAGVKYTVILGAT